MAYLYLLFLSALVLMTLITLQGANAVQYTVTNNAIGTPGGLRFTNEVGLVYSKNTLQSASEFIWRTFRQNKLTDRKNVPVVSMFVDNMDGIAFASNNQIHVSAKYIAGYTGNVRTEITGVLYHETVHIWQWNGNGNGNAPTSLTEGIADYVRLKAGYPVQGWAKPGDGDRWDQGYSHTARFLDYCNDLRNGFVADLNSKMKTGYSNTFFNDLLGKSPEQLFADYKAKYAKGA